MDEYSSLLWEDGICHQFHCLFSVSMKTTVPIDNSMPLQEALLQ